MTHDEKIMREVLMLAKRGARSVSPNPMVGAVILKNGKIVSRGYHRKYGASHAEINALKKLKFMAKNCSLFINLEPCCHYGKTPPCVDAIIKSGIKNVVIGMKDPNPLVSGKGVKALQKARIKVTKNVLKKDCEELNEVYVKYINSKIPFVYLKAAISLDGKIAMHNGESKWITGPLARKYVHKVRSISDAVLVGVKTVIKDNPSLNARNAGKIKNPLRVILDSNLKAPLNSKVFKVNKNIKTAVFTNNSSSKRKTAYLRKKGIIVKKVKSDSTGLNLREILKELGKMNVASVLVEGGNEIFTSFIRNKLADKVILIYGNKILGGENSLSCFGNVGVSKLNQAFTLKSLSVIRLGQDTIVSGYLG